MSSAARDGLPRSAARNGTLSVGCIWRSPDGHNGGARCASPFYPIFTPNRIRTMWSGHTHGGQIRLPGIGIIRTATKAPRRWTHGLVEERGQYLYVTSGIGTSGLPLRWGVPPEIVVLDTAGKQRT